MRQEQPDHAKIWATAPLASEQECRPERRRHSQAPRSPLSNQKKQSPLHVAIHEQRTRKKHSPEPLLPRSSCFLFFIFSHFCSFLHFLKSFSFSYFTFPKKKFLFFFLVFLSNIFFLLALVSEFNCFFRCRYSMEMWCPDDIGRDSWDWVWPSAWEKACFNSTEWGEGSSPVKTEPHQIVLLLLMMLMMLMLLMLLMLLIQIQIQIQIQIRQWKQVATQTITALQGELTPRKTPQLEARPHSVLVPSASTLTRDTAASAPPFHTQTNKANSVMVQVL